MKHPGDASDQRVARQIDVLTIIEHQTASPFQIALMVWVSLTMLLDGYDLQLVGYAAPTMIKALGVSKAEFAPLLSMALFGFMLSATFLGKLGDRFGRRRLIVAGVLLFGSATLACAYAGSLEALLYLRFLAGIGLGIAIPNAIALTAEYAPARARGTRISILFVAFTIGSAIAGFIAAQTIPAYGWRSVFVVGGVVPLLAGALLALYLPESARFLAVTRRRPKDLARIMLRMQPQLAGSRVEFTAQGEERGNAAIKQLFTEGRAVMTVLLWGAFVANMIELTFITSWMPTVITDGGLGMKQAVIATSLFQVGGAIGTIAIGRLVDRLGIHVIAAAFIIGAPIVAAIGFSSASEPLLMLLSVAAGWCIPGGQAGINALAGTLYPTYMRSTGVGWAFGVGRVGSVLGPLVGGLLIAHIASIRILFLCAAVPALMAAAAMFALKRALAGTSTELIETGPAALPAAQVGRLE